MDKIGYHREVLLSPTLWTLDVFVCNDIQKIARLFHKRYGASKQYYIDEISPNQVSLIYSTESSKMKGDSRIVMVVEGFKANIIVHELIHVLYVLSKNSGVEIGYKAQEWQACMMEYLFRECMDKKQYSEWVK